MCAKNICSWLLIDTLDQYPLSSINTRLILDQHLRWYSINISGNSWSRVNYVSKTSHRVSIVNWPSTVSQSLTACLSGVDWDVDWVSMEYWLRYLSGVDQVLIKGSSKVHQGLIKGVYGHLTVDALSTRDPKCEQFATIRLWQQLVLLKGVGQ